MAWELGLWFRWVGDTQHTHIGPESACACVYTELVKGQYCSVESSKRVLLVLLGLSPTSICECDLSFWGMRFTCFMRVRRIQNSLRPVKLNHAHFGVYTWTTTTIILLIVLNCFPTYIRTHHKYHVRQSVYNGPNSYVCFVGLLMEMHSFRIERQECGNDINHKWNPKWLAGNAHRAQWIWIWF